MLKILKWTLFFVPALAIELVCYSTNWFAAMFTTRAPRFDVVKRLDKQKVVLERDYLVGLFYLWQTHDNAVDEWWYGMYNEDHWFDFAKNWTQHDYDNSWFIRYYCRVCWLYRNNAYGWLYKLFSTPVEPLDKNYSYGVEDSGKFWFNLDLFNSSWKLEAQIPLLGKRFYSINIGWKAHKTMPRKLYANRVIGFRKYD